MIQDDKFIVFKRDEWDKWKSDGMSRGEAPDVVEDAVVLRLQDEFASTAIRAYSDAVVTVIGIMQGIGYKVPESLLSISDHFVELSEQAQNLKQRFETGVPD